MTESSRPRSPRRRSTTTHSDDPDQLSDGRAPDRTARSDGQRHRSRHLAARRRLGRRERGRGAVGTRDRRRARGDVLRHRRRLRRRSQRALLRSAAPRHPEVFVATKMGRRAEQLPENYNLENFLAWNDRSRENLGIGRSIWSSCIVRRTRCTTTTACSRRWTSWSRRGGRTAYGVSVETSDQALRAIERPHVGDRADRPQLLPPEAPRGGAPGRAGRGRWDHRARAARLRTALGSLRRAHRVRRR